MRDPATRAEVHERTVRIPPRGLDLNREALAALRCEKELAIVPGTTHLFEEAGTLEQVVELAGHWFCDHLRTEDEP